MTVLVKYKKQNKKNNEEWIKRMEAKEIDWAYWGGWFDSDGSFYTQTLSAMFKSKRKTQKLYAQLELKDREPVELFSKTFETSLLYCEKNTITPNGAKYRAKLFISVLRNERAHWFAEKIQKYIFNKKDYVKTLIENLDSKYDPGEQNITAKEFVPYLTSLLEGDGSYAKVNDKNNVASLYSSNLNFLNWVKDTAFKLNVVNFGNIYVAKKLNNNLYYHIRIDCHKNDTAKSFLNQSIPFMNIDRKKQRAISKLNLLN